MPRRRRRREHRNEAGTGLMSFIISVSCQTIKSLKRINSLIWFRLKTKQKQIKKEKLQVKRPLIIVIISRSNRDSDRINHQIAT